MHICCFNQRHILGWFKIRIRLLYLFIKDWCLLNIFISGDIRNGVKDFLNFIMQFIHLLNIFRRLIFCKLLLFLLRILKFINLSKFCCIFREFCLMHISDFKWSHWSLCLGFHNNRFTRLFQFFEVWCLLNLLLSSGFLINRVNAIFDFLLNLTDMIFNLNAHFLFLILSLLLLRNSNFKHFKKIYECFIMFFSCIHPIQWQGGMPYFYKSP